MNLSSLAEHWDLLLALLVPSFGGLLIMTKLYLKERAKNFCINCPTKILMVHIIKIQLKLCEMAKIDCTELWDSLTEMQKEV